MLKRYLLFAGNTYYPGGGWSDFQGAFDSALEAKAQWDSERFDWFEVVDTTTLEVQNGDTGVFTHGR